ncbi:MAG: hypothetical protein VX519_08105 [Myxococcota bacterium]|nr:hypothetical protein [Myxococcota bacterium]
MRSAVWMLIILGACTGTHPEATNDASPLDATWVGQLALNPQQFQTLLDDSRNGWSAYHAGELQKASTQPGLVKARAHRDLSELHARLGTLGGLAWKSIVATWDTRTGLPTDSGITWFAALAAMESGDVAQATTWLTMASSVDYPPVSQAAQALLKAGQFKHMDFATPPSSPLLVRLQTHIEARKSGDSKPLLTEANRPLLVETGAGHERPFFDPQLPWTLAHTHATAAGKLPSDPLAAVIFTGCPNGDTARSSTLQQAHSTAAPHCATDALWTDIGLDLDLTETDDQDKVRAFARELDAIIDTWRGSLLERSTEDGRALVEDLQLVAIFRGRVLIDQALRSLDAGHPRQAQALLQMAQDLSQPRTITPLNPAILYALLAETHLRTGHTREALDALEILVEAFPAAKGIDETVGDLAVLQGLDRRGDSKEL